MVWFHPPSCAIYTPRESLKSISIQLPPPTYLSIFYSYSPRPWCLASCLCLGVFSVPGIYVETYAYDDMYVRILMTQYFCAYARIVM